MLKILRNVNVKALILLVIIFILTFQFSGTVFALNEQLDNAQTHHWIILALLVLLLYIVIAAYFLFFFKKQPNSKNIKKKGKPKLHAKVLEVATIPAQFNQQEQQKYWRYFYFLIGVSLLLRLLVAPLYKGYHYDYGMFKYWADLAANNLWNIYHPNVAYIDYPPVYVALLGIVGTINKLFQIVPDSGFGIIMLKLPAILAELITGYVLFSLAQKYFDLRKALVLSALYLFNPAIWFDSLIWGQVDAVFFLTVLLVFWFIFENKLAWAACFMAISILTKPQGFMFVPMLFFELLRQKSLGTFIKATMSGIATFIIILLPFSIGNPDSLWWYNLLFKMTGNFPYASVNAFNFFALMGANWVDDSGQFLLLTYKTWGDIFLFFVVVSTAYLYWKDKSRISFLLAALLLNIGAFNLSSRMHERYLYPVMIIILLIYIFKRDKKALFIYLGTTITNFLNIFLSFIPVATTDVSKSENAGVCWIASSNPLVWITAFINLILLFYTLYFIFNQIQVKEDKTFRKLKGLSV